MRRGFTSLHARSRSSILRSFLLCCRRSPLVAPLLFAETWTRPSTRIVRTWFAHCTFVRNAKASQKQNEEQGLQVLAAAQEDFERRDHRKAPAAKEDFDCRDQQQEEECLYTDGSASQEEDEVEAAPRPPCRLEEAGAVSSESAFLQQDEPTHGVQRGREHLRHVCAQLHRASKLKTRHITRRECIVREREADGTLAVTNVQTVDSLADLSRRVSRATPSPSCVSWCSTSWLREHRPQCRVRGGLQPPGVPEAVRLGVSIGTSIRRI